MKPNYMIVSRQTYDDLIDIYKDYKFQAEDGKVYRFNTKKELEEFKAKYKHDKNFNNKLESILGE